MVEPYYVGVDVGTASVRAALVSRNGKIVSSAIRPLKIWKSQPNYFEQSSEDIWRNVCTVVKVVVTQFYDLGPPEEVGGELSAEHGGVPHPSQNPRLRAVPLRSVTSKLGRSPVLPSLDVTARRGTARSLSKSLF